MTVGVCILSAVRVAHSQVEDNTSLQAINSALSVFVMISSVNGVVRALHKLMVRVWEGKRTHADMLIASSLQRKTTPTARAITRRPEHLTSRLTANLSKRTAKDVATLLPVSDDEETSTLYVPPQSSLPSSEFREERVRRWLAAAAASSSHNTTRRQVDDAAATAVALPTPPRTFPPGGNNSAVHRHQHVFSTDTLGGRKSLRPSQFGAVPPMTPHETVRNLSRLVDLAVRINTTNRLEDWERRGRATSLMLLTSEERRML
ncbi:Hypothetical protein, putative [Bodo saltans]|uniref:Uncharacterized protein n=1 Tax=Bodo saltans TaxID=75058 RepID=A0A0S4IXE3_BODSA|nr:Hypothetical protein, putative [Bodo saltans]|eukprot:CUG39322.1 Hypothetical protein, putative [Bodo saltans]